MVSTSFQIFALTAGGMSEVGREIARKQECPGNVVHSLLCIGQSTTMTRPNECFSSYVSESQYCGFN